MSLEWDREEGVSHIRLSGQTDISMAAELKAALLELLAAPERQLTIDLSAVSEFHISIIQLVWAAANETHQRGIAFHVRPPGDARVMNMLIELGVGLPSTRDTNQSRECAA